MPPNGWWSPINIIPNRLRNCKKTQFYLLTFKHNNNNVTLAHWEPIVLLRKEWWWKNCYIFFSLIDLKICDKIEWRKKLYKTFRITYFLLSADTTYYIIIITKIVIQYVIKICHKFFSALKHGRLTKGECSVRLTSSLG